MTKTKTKTEEAQAASPEDKPKSIPRLRDNQFLMGMLITGIFWIGDKFIEAFKISPTAYLIPYSFKIFKNTVIREYSNYSLFLVVTIFAAAMLYLINDALTTKNRGVKYTSSAAAIIVFLVYMAYGTVQQAAEDVYTSFKVKSICSDMTYEEVNRFKKSVISAPNFDSAYETIKAVECKP